jgi:hypothetical protein
MFGLTVTVYCETFVSLKEIEIEIVVLFVTELKNQLKYE